MDAKIVQDKFSEAFDYFDRHMRGYIKGDENLASDIKKFLITLENSGFDHDVIKVFESIADTLIQRAIVTSKDLAVLDSLKEMMNEIKFKFKNET